MGNKFELNKGDQFIVAFDTSGSMQTADCPGNTTRFDYVLETMRTFIAEAAKWDPDGVSFYVFNSSLKVYPDVASVATINDTIGRVKPGGRTSTHLALDAAFKEHQKKGSEKTFLMLFTDGEPSEPEEVKKSVVRITQQVKDENEFRISILTVGQRTPELNTWLDNLDDHLDEAKYDIIDISKLEDVNFDEAIANAIAG